MCVCVFLPSHHLPAHLLLLLLYFIGAKIAGPAISLSFLGCGIACILTSLAYAEFASLIPTAGSAYTYVYVAFGEFYSWLVGWFLILGYGFTASVAARGKFSFSV